MPSHSSMILMLLKLLFLFGVSNVHAGGDLSFKDDFDLTSFVSRPEIKAPLFNVTVHDASAVSPGYWFVAPYVKIVQDRPAMHYYQACQTGPSIYDGAGNLVWTGACLFRNQNACDFRASRYNNSDHLSTVLCAEDKTGHGVIMNSSFSITDLMYPPKLAMNNMHEFNIIEEGRTGLAIIGRTELVDISELGIYEEVGWVANVGFREFDVATGQTKFEWWALDHVPLSASSEKIGKIKGPHPSGWNYFHMNSVDKDSSGDYLISARYTNCIYKISGNDGSVIWQLGGTNSSFVLDGFNFSRQHDARFIEYNATTEIISFLDNAADLVNTTSTYSSALLVALDISVTPMVAKVIRRWIRPDRELSRLRGNFQLLPNGNAFIGWSSNSYISEHTYDGELVMEAQFASYRFVTYRAYKFNFTGNPIEPPTLKTFVYGTSPATSTTACYVSWNGATEVESWAFYQSDSSMTSPSFIGSTLKTGFETMFQSSGFESSVYAEAISADGKVLGRSPIEATIKPSTWQHVQQINRGTDLNDASINEEDDLDGIQVDLNKHRLLENQADTYIYKQEL